MQAKINRVASRKEQLVMGKTWLCSSKRQGLLSLPHKQPQTSIFSLSVVVAALTAAFAPFFNASAHVLEAALPAFPVGLSSKPSISLESKSLMVKSPETSSPLYVPFHESLTVNSKPSRGLPLIK